MTQPEISDSLSKVQMQALWRMPVRLTVSGALPSGSPSGATIKALERKGLVQLAVDGWYLTRRGKRTRDGR